MFFELDIDPKESAVGRFIGSVRKVLLRVALAEKESNAVTQQSIANKLGVNRSVVNRLLKGEANLTLRSVAEIAWALGYRAEITLQKIDQVALAHVLPAADTNATAIPKLLIKGGSITAEEYFKMLPALPVRPKVIGTGNDNYAPVKVAS
jgi:plasmid maintenance system antidote protein VapI